MLSSSERAINPTDKDAYPGCLLVVRSAFLVSFMHSVKKRVWESDPCSPALAHFD